MPYWHQWNLIGRCIILLNLSFRAFRLRRQAKLATAHQAQGLDQKASIPNALPRRYLRGFSFAVMRAKIVGYRSTESSLRKACLVREGIM